MQLYDCPAYLDSNTNNRGIVVIRDTALSILGTATPAELSTALTVNDWHNGNLARFALLTPEVDYAPGLRRKPVSRRITWSFGCGICMSVYQNLCCPVSRVTFQAGRWSPTSGITALPMSKRCAP